MQRYALHGLLEERTSAAVISDILHHGILCWTYGIRSC